MKVLFLSIYDPFKPSGPSNHLRNLSMALTELGCEVHVLVPGLKTESTIIDGLTIHRVKTLPFGGGFFFSLTTVGWVNQIVKKYGIDIIHGQSPSSVGYALLSSAATPFVVTMHSTSFGELSSLTNVSTKGLNLLLLRDFLIVQPITSFLTFIEYTFADYVMVVSDSIAKEAKQFYHIPEDKIITIHNGSNPFPASQMSIQNSVRFILFVGRLVWRKGVKYIIEAMPEVLSQYPNTKLQIVGTGDQEAFLIQLVKDLNLEGAVQFLGSVSEKELCELYREADVYLQPSLYEPCPLAILDAMSAGKPVVATNVGGIPELIENGVEGFLVEPANSLKLAEAVKKVLSDDAFKEQIGINSRARVERCFNWKNIAAQTIACYNKILTEA